MAIATPDSDERHPAIDRLEVSIKVTYLRCAGICLAALFVLRVCFDARADASPTLSAAPDSLRLYVLDCGAIHVADTARYELRRDEVESSELSVACFLEWQPTGGTIVHRLTLPDAQTRDITLTRPLGAQLAEIGYPPLKIRYLALPHYHYDHTANANAFAQSTWLVRQAERAAMFATTPPGTTRPDTYAQLKSSKTTLIEKDQFDVFGDSRVVIKFAPGHTPGHQMLLVRLKNTGPVLLSGDLYHFPQERTLNRFPVFAFDKEQTRHTRVEIEEYLRAVGASLWIQHDFIGNGNLRKSPAFYDY